MAEENILAQKRNHTNDSSNGFAEGSPEKKQKMDLKGVLLGYGNPLLDISVQATKEYLDKDQLNEKGKQWRYGLEANNACLAEEKHKPMYAEMSEQFKDVEYVPGGATLNAVRVAQWLLQTPDATSFFGCIADDKFGAILTKAAKTAGVDVKFQYTTKEPTGTCAVVCTDKNRSLVANLAAANCFTEEHLDDPENWAQVEMAKFYYFATTDRKEIAKKIGEWSKVNKSRPRIVVITQGSDPVLVYTDGQVKEYPVITIASDAIVDSNGAGDSFVGGFLSQLVQGKSLEECIRCGHHTANIVLQRTGCTLPDKPTFV